MVLVDAPCSGFGIIRKKPDVRYKKPDDLFALPVIQRAILDNAARYVRPGGTLVYSVCTVTKAETIDVARALTGPGLEPLPMVHDRWRSWGSGGLVLPQDHDTDGMAVFRWLVS